MADSDRADDSAGPELIGDAFASLRARFESAEFQSLLVARESAVREADLRMERNRRRVAVVASGVAVTPEDLESIVADTLEPTTALRYVRSWLTRATTPEPGRPAMRFLGLLGGTGIGKTVACAWAIAKLGSGVAVKAEELGRVLLGFKRDQAAADRILKARLLVIDDLGTEEMRGFSTALYESVDHRLSQAWALTAITSNLGLEAFEAKYESRTISRLRHRGYLGEVKGRDLRAGGQARIEGT